MGEDELVAAVVKAFEEATDTSKGIYKGEVLYIEIPSDQWSNLVSAVRFLKEDNDRART